MYENKQDIENQRSYEKDQNIIKGSASTKIFVTKSLDK